MGITIHYRGRAASKKAVDRIMHAVTLMACEWEWPCAQVEDPDGEIIRMRRDVERDKERKKLGLEGEEPNFLEIASDGQLSEELEEYHGPVYMLVTQPGEGCESLRLMFDREWRMEGFIKTQYGPVETHVKVCRVLRAIERHFEEFEVRDEAEFWDHDDLEALKERWGERYVSEEAAIAMYEAAKQKRAMENMYKIGGEDGDQDE